MRSAASEITSAWIRCAGLLAAVMPLGALAAGEPPGEAARLLFNGLPLSVLYWLADNQEASVVLLLAGFGLIQYRNERRWKKKEFAFSCINQIKAEPRYQAIVNAVAWDHYPVTRDTEAPDGTPIRMTEQVSQSRLFKLIADDLLDDPPSATRSEADFYLLKNVDIYLTELDQFFHYIRCGLFHYSDCHQYIGYTFNEYAKGMRTLRTLKRVPWRATAPALAAAAPTLMHELRENAPVFSGLDDRQRLVLAILLYAAAWGYGNFLEELDLYERAAWQRPLARRLHQLRRLRAGLAAPDTSESKTSIAE